MATNGIIPWPGIQNSGYRLTVPSLLLELTESCGFTQIRYWPVPVLREADFSFPIHSVSIQHP